MSNRQGNNRMGGRYGGGGGMHDRNQRPSLNPWQQSSPAANISSLLPLASSSTQATLALANNLISNLLQTRAVPSAVPSLLDMPMGRDFDINPLGRNYDNRSYNNMRMGNQGNFRRPPNTFNRFNDNRNKKSDGPRNKQTPKKDAVDKKSAKPQESSVKSEDGKEEKNQDIKEESAEGSSETPKTAYDDIRPEFLECHICNKSMWDGRSFENHINGRAHNIMMLKTTESYALVVDTMRQELKINDMKKNRHLMQNRKKDFFCNMCDMYATDGAYHRTTVGHRKLKKYLHPACNTCHQEMPTRIELDRHRLTPEHMLKLQEAQEQTGTTRRVEPLIISTLSTELAYIEEGLNRKRNRVMRQKAQQARQRAARKDGDTTEDTPAETEDTKSAEDLEEAPPDTETTILDYTEGDDLSEISREKLPVYNSQRPIGKNFIIDFVCKHCTLCDRLLDSEETAEAHMRTRKHHHTFLKKLEEKSGKDLMIERNKRSGPRHSQGGSDAKRQKSDNEHNGENVKQEAGQENQGDEQNDGDVEMAVKEEDWEKDVDDILNSEDGQDEGNYDEQIEQEQEHDESQEGQYEGQQDGDYTEEQNEEQHQVEEEKPAPVPTPEPDTPSRRGRPARRRASRF